MHSTVLFDEATSDAFPVSSRVKQGCILALTLFGIFSMLLHCALANYPEGVYICTRSDGKLFNIVWLRARTKVTEVLIHELLFAEDAVLTSYSKEGLQCLVSHLSQACKEFGLTIRLMKTKIMAQDSQTPPVITIDNTQLAVVDTFTYCLKCPLPGR